MDGSTAIDSLAALAQDTRLDVFRLLVRHEPDGLSVGEIARQLAVPQNTMSSHLAVLRRGGLVRSIRHGRSITYRADLAGLQRLIGFLLMDCCGGRAEICAPLIADLAPGCITQQG